MQLVGLDALKLEFSQALSAKGPGLVMDVVKEVLRDQLGQFGFESFHDM